jgi:glycosyltransferase involved in cell wall biosynthesis
MKISLILPTIETDRVELTRFLDSLLLQSYRNWELIIIDQNPDDRIDDFTQPYLDRLNFVHLKTEPGLSRARNTGLQASCGEVFCFPDDDCWYSPNLLARVVEQLESHPEWAGITGRCLDQTGEPVYGKWDQRPVTITIYNVWGRGLSVTIFLKRSAIEAIGKFDESLGLGSITHVKSGEEMDYLMRVLEKGFHLEYIPGLEVYHPHELMGGREANHKAFSYSFGEGWVIRKHHLPLWFIAKIMLWRVGGIGKAWLSGNTIRAYYVRSILNGLIQGYLHRDL